MSEEKRNDSLPTEHENETPASDGLSFEELKEKQYTDENGHIIYG